MTNPRTEEVPPNPAAMIESMRAFGYSLPGAIADLVDNSISAGAARVDITMYWDGPESWILVADDGRGMTGDELTNAMRLGSRSPREVRDPDDLGRFGLGLKTAAFSQGTSLTVVSRTETTSAELRSWDLDHVTKTGRWSLICEPLARDAPAEDAVATDLNTGVLLTRLDRLVGVADVEDEHAKDHFLAHAKSVRAHLSMVFHRFLECGLKISVNSHAIEAWDPFLRSNSATQELPVEKLLLGTRAVEVMPTVLPHYSRLSTEEHEKGAGPRGWNPHQGFYVYRARRLLVPGDWLGLPMQKEEHYKLARIRVDLDNSMDELWQIDVRKATARIPRQLRDEMRRIATATRSQAAEAYRYRGKRVARKANVERSFVWASNVNRGQVTYRIDREHPLIADVLQQAEDKASSVEKALRIVEETIPVQSIMIDLREEPDTNREPFAKGGRVIMTMLKDLHSKMVAAGADSEETIELLSRTEPFSSHPQVIAIYMEELANGRGTDGGSISVGARTRSYYSRVGGCQRRQP